MSLNKIEIEHLLEDELFYEIFIRGMAISQVLRQNVKNLKERLISESRGLSVAPTVYSGGSVELEFKTCQQKYDGIIKQIGNQKDTITLEDILVYNSRLYHLNQRLKRLITRDESMVKKISELELDVAFCLDRLSSLINRNTSSNTASQAENLCSFDISDKESQSGDVNDFWERQVEALSSTNKKNMPAQTADSRVSNLESDLRNISLSPIHSSNTNMENNPVSKGAIPKNSRPIISIPQPTVVQSRALENPQSILRNTNTSFQTTQNVVKDNFQCFSDFIRAPRRPTPLDKEVIDLSDEQFEINDLLNKTLGLNYGTKNHNYDQYTQSQSNKVRFAPELNYVGDPRNPNINNNFSHRRSPIASWGLNFTGNVGGQSLNDFLDKVNLYALADGITSADLLNSAVYLFSGSTLTWFQAFGTAYRTWEELVSAMITMFLNPDYDYELLQEIYQRKQGEGESFGVYIANMEMLFRQLESINVTEQRKLDIIIRNMKTSLAEKIILIDITSIQHLARLCRKIESFDFKKSRSEGPSNNTLLEPRFSSFRQQNIPTKKPQISVVEENNHKTTPIRNSQRSYEDLECWNCLRKGHDYTQCKQPKLRIFCFNCGEIGQVSRNYRNCEKNEEGGTARRFQASQYRKPNKY